MMSLVITPGEPAGIGPNIVLQIAAAHPELSITIIADKDMIAERAKLLKISCDGLNVQHVPLMEPCQPGKLNPANAQYVLECLRQATQGCLEGKFHALVTGPVHKGVINEAGVPFSGHTEFLAQFTHSPLAVMLFVTETFRVALLTTHIPLAAVSAAVTERKLTDTISILASGLEQRLGIAHPRIAVCGLNPHAGEGGHLGREEIEVVTPTIMKLRRQGYDLLGPVPADTAFTPTALKQCDAVLAMYHDQALPVVKAQSFSSGVNVTLGLPIIRTSVDHGTALDLAGSGQADPSSLLAAITLALQIRS